MKGNIAIIAALPGELKPLVTHPSHPGWKRLPSTNGCDLWEHHHPDGCWLALCAGMGATRATVAFAEATKRLQIDAVCSVGWAGALNESIPAGAVFAISQVVDTRTGERFHPAHSQADAPILATITQVADSEEKRRLAASYGASLVDMEAATVARIAQGRAIPFFCFKAVSDDAAAKLPNLNPFIDRVGQLRMLPFLLHVAVRPASWPALLQLGRHSNTAARNLADTLYRWLEQKDLQTESYVGVSRQPEGQRPDNITA